MAVVTVVLGCCLISRSPVSTSRACWRTKRTSHLKLAVPIVDRAGRQRPSDRDTDSSEEFQWLSYLKLRVGTLIPLEMSRGLRPSPPPPGHPARRRGSPRLVADAELGMARCSHRRCVAGARGRSGGSPRPHAAPGRGRPAGRLTGSPAAAARTATARRSGSPPLSRPAISPLGMLAVPSSMRAHTVAERSPA